jgi:hypothetical protein
MPGLAHDIGIGANGSVWVIGTNRIPHGGPHLIVRMEDYGTFNWIETNPPTEGKWQEDPGGRGQRIAVDQNGDPWTTAVEPTFLRNTYFDGYIRRLVGGQWEFVNNNVPGIQLAVGFDIGVGANGSAWVIGTHPLGTIEDDVHNIEFRLGDLKYDGDFTIYQWKEGAWRDVDGGARRGIAVDPAGLPWVVNSKGEIYQRVRQD